MEPKKLSIHKQLVTFFSDTALKTRGFRPHIAPKDAQQLQRVMKLGIFDQSRMEQIMLYFLADKNYKNLGPSLATMFSGTILNSLRNAALNREKFYKELDGYAMRYLVRGAPTTKRVAYDPEDNPGTGPVSMADLLAKLATQMTLNKSAAPRAPVVAERSKKKALTLFETKK